ncbi:MAG TPA: hypothetical protein VFG79_18060, partial [Solirubrobacter sp.]|nr:hypothetical protein [Solirubrobacter sp.]
GWRERLAYAAAALAVLLGGTLAVSPAARSTVLRWLGIESVESRRGPPRPTAGASLRLGPPATVDGLRDDGVRVLVPRALDAPDGVFETTLPGGTLAASLVYDGGRLLVQSFEARATPFIEKTIGVGADVEELDVDGATAYWITDAHGFAYSTDQGVGFEEQRLAGPTLLVDRADGILLRVEGRVPRARAVEIARSVE